MPRTSRSLQRYNNNTTAAAHVEHNIMVVQDAESGESFFVIPMKTVQAFIASLQQGDWSPKQRVDDEVVFKMSFTKFILFVVIVLSFYKLGPFFWEVADKLLWSE